MASDALTTSRRGLVAAMATLPVVAASAAASAATDPASAWKLAMIEYLDAKQTCNVMTKGMSDDDADPFVQRWIAAEEHLLAMPAPHWQALEWKLRYWVDLAGPHEHFAVVILDVQRLGAMA